MFVSSEFAHLDAADALRRPQRGVAAYAISYHIMCCYIVVCCTTLYVIV